MIKPHSISYKSQMLTLNFYFSLCVLVTGHTLCNSGIEQEVLSGIIGSGYRDRVRGRSRVLKEGSGGMKKFEGHVKPRTLDN